MISLLFFIFFIAVIGAIILETGGDELRLMARTIVDLVHKHHEDDPENYYTRQPK